MGFGHVGCGVGGFAARCFVDCLSSAPRGKRAVDGRRGFGYDVCVGRVGLQPAAPSIARRPPHAVDEQLTGAAAWVMGGMVGRTASYWERSVIGNAE